MLAFKLSRQVPKNKAEDKEASEPAEAWSFWETCERVCLNFYVESGQATDAKEGEKEAQETEVDNAESLFA